MLLTPPMSIGQINSQSIVSQCPQLSPSSSRLRWMSLWHPSLSHPSLLEAILHFGRVQNVLLFTTHCSTKKLGKYTVLLPTWWKLREKVRFRPCWSHRQNSSSLTENYIACHCCAVTVISTLEPLCNCLQAEILGWESQS